MRTARARTPIWVKLAIAAVCVAGPAWWLAQRQDRMGNERRLRAVASAIAGRPVQVHCPGVYGRIFSWDIVEGSVRFDASGRPSDDTRLRELTCARSSTHSPRAGGPAPSRASRPAGPAAGRRTTSRSRSTCSPTSPGTCPACSTRRSPSARRSRPSRGPHSASVPPRSRVARSLGGTWRTGIRAYRTATAPGTAWTEAGSTCGLRSELAVATPPSRPRGRATGDATASKWRSHRRSRRASQTM